MTEHFNFQNKNNLKKMAKQTKNPKTLNFVIQSKGGVGKSFMIWLSANVYQNDEKTIFIDLDNSTKTTNKRLASVIDESRISHYSILDEQKKIEREEFLNMLDTFSQADFNQMFIDFGAPESEELLKFLQYEFSAETLKDACEELGIEINFMIVLAGNDTITACLSYSVTITNLVKEHFKTYWFLNLGLSGGIDARTATIDTINDVIQQAQLNTQVIPFGDLGFSQSAKDIIQMLANNSKPSELSFASNLKFKQVLKDFTNQVKK